MKIKLALLDNDKRYIERITTAFNTKYSNEFEIYSFTNLSMAMDSLKSNNIDVFIANNSFDIDLTMIPEKCGFAYLIDSADVDIVLNQRAISKFQKIDLIYKNILNIYSENTEYSSFLEEGSDNTKVIIFSSPSGGVGTSSVAVACAKNFAKHNKKTLYLNLERFGMSDLFFNADGNFDMYDVIYALNSGKGALSMKLESCVKQDNSGVYFYSQSKNALDMLEITGEDILNLISEFRHMRKYDYIVIDMDFILNDDLMQLYKNSYAIVWVSDGSEISNIKTQRVFDAISILQKNVNANLVNRIHLVYNKFSNKTSKKVANVDLKEIGGAPRYEHASTQQIIEQLLSLNELMNGFNNLN